MKLKLRESVQPTCTIEQAQLTNLTTYNVYCLRYCYFGKNCWKN